MTEKSKQPEKLLIIGNGFDLVCGLPSKISDYLNQVDDRLSKAFTEIENAMAKNQSSAEDSGDIYPIFKSFLANTSYTNNVRKIVKEVTGKNYLSFWDLLFKLCSEKNRNWNQVEDEIKQVVLGNQDESIKSLLNSQIYGKSPESICLMKVIGVLSFLRGIDANDLFSKNFLKNELRKFENNFANYLIGATEINLRSYLESAELLTQKLVHNNPYNVLSFNYTFPFNLYSQKAIPKKYKNVHGTLKESAFMGPIDANNYPSYDSNNIIFGIDASNISDTRSPEAYTFTKTFRSLANTSLPTRNLLFDGINEIVFYGHSLSHADYSYFLSIFDHYNIYDNTKISLTFCYNPKLSQYNQFKMVTHLLNAYGNSLTNQNHGNNLLHKLILEGRLSIKPVKFDKVD